MNKVILEGHLGADPQINYLDNGHTVCNLRLATNEYYYQNGERRQRTEWHRIVVFGNQAVACENLHKGSHVLIEDGRNQTRKFTGNDEVVRYVTEVVANRIVFLDRRPAEKPAPAPDLEKAMNEQPNA
jgi:single-strand DNA-binding protein